MKHGIQITTTKDGAWSVSQLIQQTQNGKFKRTGGVLFVDRSRPEADQQLLNAVKKGLNGEISSTSDI
jgi:hypothetical protein